MAEGSEEVTTLSRKIRMRGGHRATVTRLINELDSAIAAADTSRLIQVGRSLKNKMEVLSTLDEEIVSQVDFNQMGAEIEQADLVKERIELAMIKVQAALDRPREEARPSSHSSSPSTRSRHSSFRLWYRSSTCKICWGHTSRTGRALTTPACSWRLSGCSAS